jgi:GNAT superfamily N-acetyltransferase
MIRVRPLASSDAPAWRGLWREYLTFYDITLADEVYRASFARMTDADVGDYHGLIAEDAGEAVGLVHYIFHRHGWRLEEVCYLQDLFVAPAARGKGVGRALIEAVYARADAAGRPEVYWLTQEFNAGARRLYDAVGERTPLIKYRRPAR